MVTIKCKQPCPFGIGAPTGEHCHHFHSKSKPDCIIDRAKYLRIRTKYLCTEDECQRLQLLAKEKNLGEKIIKFLDHNYRGAHNCPDEIIKRGGGFSAVVGMCWDIAITNYHKTAKFIEDPSQKNKVSLFGKPGDVMVDFL